MSRLIEAAHLLLETGWVSPGHIVVADDGTISEAGPGLSGVPDVRLSGYVLPSMPNVHSHAHHRGLVGHADRLSAGRAETLWSWRQTMYRHLDGLSPDDLEAYATLAYIEMLRRGYTSVGEFHYLHHDPTGARYADPAEMSKRILAAGRAAGIAVTILPALYTSGGVGRPPEGQQRRFVTTLGEYVALVGALSELARADPLVSVGVAPHSLRAVAAAELAALLHASPTGPIHIHAAERVEEVEEISRELGAAPVEWLLDNVPMDGRWCVIHATHMTEAETRGLAASGAVVGICPLTEANLGDGRFSLAAFRGAGGRFAIGTDANHLIDLPGELRLLEYGQRLSSHRRETILAGDETSVAAVLYGAAREGGARALDQSSHVLRPGERCDLIELDSEHVALAGQTPETVLDAWIFSTASDTLVRTVVVAGDVVVSDGHHPLEDDARRRVDRVMRRRHLSDCAPEAGGRARPRPLARNPGEPAGGHRVSKPTS